MKLNEILKVSGRAILVISVLIATGYWKESVVCLQGLMVDGLSNNKEGFSLTARIWLLKTK